MINKAPDRVWITWDDAYPWPTPEMGGDEYRRVDPPAAPTTDVIKVLLDYVAECNSAIDRVVTEPEKLRLRYLQAAANEIFRRVSAATPTVPADERDKATFRTVEQLDGSVATFADTDWCSECHAYTHKPNCRSARLTAKTPLADQIVNAVYRSMAQYEDGTWFLDNLKAKARVNRLLATVRAEVFKAGLLQAARDICPYCGARAVAFFSSVDGPNEAGNFTHQHRTDNAAQALCKASAIYSRLESPHTGKVEG